MKRRLLSLLLIVSLVFTVSGCGMPDDQVKWSKLAMEKVLTAIDRYDTDTKEISHSEVARKKADSYTVTSIFKDAGNVTYTIVVTTNDTTTGKVGTGWAPYQNETDIVHNVSLTVGDYSPVFNDNLQEITGYYEQYFFNFNGEKLELLGYNIYSKPNFPIECYCAEWGAPMKISDDWVESPYDARNNIIM